jgi:hypothetical protein
MSFYCIHVYSAILRLKNCRCFQWLHTPQFSWKGYQLCISGLRYRLHTLPFLHLRYLEGGYELCIGGLRYRLHTQPFLHWRYLEGITTAYFTIIILFKMPHPVSRICRVLPERYTCVIFVLVFCMYKT